MHKPGEKWEHGWGFKDTAFEIGPDGAVRLAGNRYEISGFSMPGFLPFCEDVLDVKLDVHNQLEAVPLQVAAVNRNEAFCAAVAAEFPESDYSYDDGVRATHSHGQGTGDEVYQALYGRLRRVVDMVFFCRSETAVQRIIQLAIEHDVCVIPYGGGTNVTGCLVLPLEEKRMIVSLNTRGLNAIEWINKENRQACVQAGITGTELEAALRREGLTCGHEPDSVELSTLGGWISTNASGMKRHRYGGIEDIVEQIFMVTPKGEFETYAHFPRQSVGVQVRPALFGSEGNFGLITKAVIRVHRLPECTSYQSLLFPDFEHGVRFLHALVGCSFLPASIRLVDNNQFRFGHALKQAESGSLARVKSKAQRAFLERVKGLNLKEMAVATIVMEGTRAEVRSQEKLIGQLAAQFRGFFGGGSNGKRGYNLTFAIAYIRDFLTKLHVMGETLETTAPWDRIEAICGAVQQEAQRISSDYGLPGRPFVSYRITQLYTTGVCIYFTYGVYTRGHDGAAIAAVADNRLRAAIVEAGGAVSNHHGVGKFRSKLLAEKLPQHNADMVKSLKNVLDERNVFGAANGVFDTTHSYEPREPSRS